MDTTTIIIAIILAIAWVFIIIEIYNAKEFDDLYGYKKDENNKSKKEDIE
jgi:hypothetical protein